ncbi:MAG: hypothetical protein Q9M48_04935 [Rhodobacterales bacterium]|nr:hypothetical protein [Rhodobacterales bacterium]
MIDHPGMNSGDHTCYSDIEPPVDSRDIATRIAPYVFENPVLAGWNFLMEKSPYCKGKSKIEIYLRLGLYNGISILQSEHWTSMTSVDLGV